MSEQHLAIQLINLGVSDETLKKIKKPVNEDLVKTNEYNKYSKNGEYLDTPTFRRLLNDAFDHKWSWEILRYELLPNDENPQYALVLGRLYLPGLGFRDAFGFARIDKKDNSAAFAAAASFAFKNAVKSTGIASNILDENWEEELYEDDYEDEEPKPTPKERAKEPETKEPPKKRVYRKDQIERMKELKEAYKIETNDQLLAFMRIWRPDLKKFSELSEKDLDDFLTFYDENEELFEDFEPEEEDVF